MLLICMLKSFIYVPCFKELVKINDEKEKNMVKRQASQLLLSLAALVHLLTIDPAYLGKKKKKKKDC